MNSAYYQEIFRAFSDDVPVSIKVIGAGNINDTLKIEGRKHNYLLQRINHQVFKNPGQVQENYQLIYAHLNNQQLSLRLPRLIKTKDGATYTTDQDRNAWRLIEFIEDAIAYEQAESLVQVREASAKMGAFVAGLNQSPLPPIRETIPDFHYFQLRYRAFELLLSRASPERLERAGTAIDFMLRHASKLPDYQALKLPRRIVHNDPKIGNVLFDGDGKVVAVIDWDTVMPGYLATDLGDMIRTMAVTADEDERNVAKVALRPDYVQCCLGNFLGPLNALLTPVEKQYLASGPLYIAMEQAIRFLYDYLSGDVYYKIQYPQHNLHRSLNQIALCQSIMRQQTLIQDTIDRILK